MRILAFIQVRMALPQVGVTQRRNAELTCDTRHFMSAVDFDVKMALCADSHSRRASRVRYTHLSVKEVIECGERYGELANK